MMSLKSFKNISNFRTKKDKMISKNVILNFDFDDVVITDNSFKYDSTFEAIDVTASNSTVSCTSSPSNERSEMIESSCGVSSSY